VTPYIRTLLLAVVIGIGIPSLYGQMSCEESNFPTITAPTQGELIAGNGLFTASVDFNTVLTSSALVELEIQTNFGANTIDVTSEFLPSGQSDFAGQSSASANLDATALGLVPGPQSLVFRLDVDGTGGPSVGIVSFTWPGQLPCEDTASGALSACFLDVGNATRQCYLNTGSACAASDAAITAAEAALQASVTGACTDGDVQALGYGAQMTAAALADRLVESCKGNAATIAARIFGGPQGKVLAAGSGTSCLDAAFAESVTFTDTAYQLQRACALDPACNPATVASDIDLAGIQSASVIDTACPSGFLEFLVGVGATDALARARSQSECMTSAAHGDVAPLALSCAPGALPGNRPSDRPLRPNTIRPRRRNTGHAGRSGLGNEMR